MIKSSSRPGPRFVPRPAQRLQPADQIPVVLALWGVITASEWVSWEGPIHAENPDLEMVRRVERRTSG